jgi:ATP-binding protein involved in chromosome partitioning
MSMTTRDDIVTKLNEILDPRTGRGLVQAGLVQGIVFRDGKAGFMIEVAPGDVAAHEPVRAAAEAAVRSLPGIVSVSAVLTAHGAAASPLPRGRPTQVSAGLKSETQPQRSSQAQGIKGVKHIVAVASGKGGVGKSTVAVNLALSLMRLGKRVGIMDADIYGPSVPQLLGLTQRPVSRDGKTLEAAEAFGLKAMSIGLLIDKDAPAVWRGPVATGALNQLLTQVEWGELDILIIDMPPGTGDIHLSLAQRVALAGAVIVSTPQDVALLDARRGIAMFRKVEVPVFGIVENMSTYVCPSCGHEEHLFGHGGARRTAEELGADFLGEVPLHLSIRIGSDEGAPVTVSNPDGPQALAFLAIAERVMNNIEGGAGLRPPPRIVYI